MGSNVELDAAGGPLLRELSEALFNLDNSSSGNLLELIKKKSIEILLEGGWRSRLSGSMRTASLLLEEAKSGLKSAGYTTLDLHARLVTPGLVGAGSGLLHTILEVGLEIDWLLGLPKIPGSTIKGALRSALEDLLGEEFADMILGEAGSGAHVSNAIILDSYPVGCLSGNEKFPCLVLTGDVVTPHYYSGGEPVEAEYQAMPVPVVHVSIAPGTVFRIIMGVRPEVVADLERFANEFNKELGEKYNIRVEPTTRGLLAGLAFLTASALASGFAARSAKGYNVMLPLVDQDVIKLSLEVVSLKLYFKAPPKPKACHSSKRPHGQRRRRQGRPKRWKT